MCPSFMVTREEQHTTRGRARLLFEMLRGDSILDGWHDEGVKESLDLCLACKGCKGDCPTSTDVATYKAEFLAHYYEHKRRPASAFALGQINRWARLAAHAPGLANFLTQTPALAAAAKRILGLAPERPLPPFAPQSFQQWWRRREPRHVDGPPVMIWPDTFNNHFHPETAQAAVEVLEGAGHQVIVPEAHLCCGRPLYDYGLLEQAKRQLDEIITTLRPEIRAGIPIVALEPSCGAVFRDELINLFPDDPDARRLSEQTLLLGEFLMKQKGGHRGHGGRAEHGGHGSEISRGTLPDKPREGDGGSATLARGRALLHGHCHQKALMGLDADHSILSGLGLEVDTPDTGCCGLAGSFGYEAERYDLSMKVGERVLLPAVREAEPRTIIVADGFSCRSQIEHGTGRQALHLAEVLRLADQGVVGQE
jgi:Fe-S oxidoreductase